MDDEDTSITAGSTVTVYVNLKRQMMKAMFDKEMLSQEDENRDNGFNLYQVRINNLINNNSTASYVVGRTILRTELLI